MAVHGTPYSTIVNHTKQEKAKVLCRAHLLLVVKSDAFQRDDLIRFSILSLVYNSVRAYSLPVSKGYRMLQLKAHPLLVCLF